MADQLSKHPVVKLYKKLPLWGKIVVPAVAFILLVSLFKLFKTIVVVGIIAALVFGVMTLAANMKKKD
jgi:hypothetical protein